MADLSIRIADMPDVLHAMIRRLADTLREEANSEAVPHTARRLRQIAADFEAGICASPPDPPDLTA